MNTEKKPPPPPLRIEETRTASQRFKLEISEEQLIALLRNLGVIPTDARMISAGADYNGEITVTWELGGVDGTHVIEVLL